MKVAGVCAGLALLCAGGAAAEVTTRDFARKAEYLSAKISPGGEYLAVATPLGDQTALGVIDVAGRKLIGALGFTRGHHVADYWWVGPARVVVAIANSGGPLDQLRLTGELFAMNADGSQKTYLFGYRGAQELGHLKRVTIEHAWAWMVNPLRNDDQHALISVMPWDRPGEAAFPLIERINVYNGTRKRLTMLPVYQPYGVLADEAGEPRLAYGADDKSALHLYTRKTGQADWITVAHPGGPPEWVQLHRISADGGSAFLTSPDARGRTCLREYRFEAATLVELHCSDTGAVGSVIFAFDGSRPIGLAYESGKPVTHFLDPAHADAKLLQALQKSFGGQRVEVTSKTLDAGKLVLRVDGDRSPGEFYLFDRATKKAQYLIASRAWIDAKQMQPVEPVDYKARDGYAIPALLTAREGLATRKAPLVVMPHGGPHGVRDYWEWDGWAQFLASRGYVVLQPNYRGSGGYGEAHQQAGYRKWGTLMQDDLTDGVRWAVEQGIADPQRVCIFGASYGGYAALMSAAREPELYRCAAAFAGVYDLESQGRDSDIGDYRFGRNYLDKVLGSDSAELAAQSPATFVGKLKAALLIGHGTSDRRVPFSQAKRLRKALDQHKKPYEWLEYKGEEHGFYVDANHEDFLNKLADFLDRHIGARAPQAAAVPAEAAH